MNCACFLQTALELFGRLEADGLRRLDLDLGAGLRIAALASLPLPHGPGAEARVEEAAFLLDHLADGREEKLHGLARGLLGHSLPGNGLDQVSFRHVFGPLEVRSAGGLRRTARGLV